MQTDASKSYKVWIVFLLFSGTLINAIDRASLSVAAPTLIKELSINAAEMGMVLSSFFWPYLIFNICAGNLVDKFGERKIMGWAAAIWSVFSALTGMADTLWHLIIARIGVGVGESASFPVNAKVTTSQFPSEQRGMVTGLYTAGLRLGFSLCPLLMAFLVARWNWRVAFYVTGIGSLLWVVLWFLSYHDAGQEKGKAATHKAIPWRELLSSRGMIGLLLAKFFQDYLLYFFVTWLPGYLVIAHNFSLIEMGTYGSLMWFAGFLNQPLMGWFSDHLIRKGVSVTAARKGCIVAMMLLSSVVIAVGFTKNFGICVALLVLAVACESAWHHALDHMLRACSKESRRQYRRHHEYGRRAGWHPFTQHYRNDSTFYGQFSNGVVHSRGHGYHGGFGCSVCYSGIEAHQVVWV